MIDRSIHRRSGRIAEVSLFDGGTNMKAKLFITYASFAALLLVGCQSLKNDLQVRDSSKSERLLKIGQSYFKQNKMLEGLGFFYEAKYYAGSNFEIECYIGLCLSYIEESKRGKANIDKYLDNENNPDPYLLNRIANVYGHIFKDQLKALLILDHAIAINNSTYCWDYIEKAYMYAYMNNKIEAINMLNIAFDIAKKYNDTAGMETAHQLIEQIDELILGFRGKT